MSLTGLNVATSLELASLTDWNNIEAVYDLSGGYGRISMMIDEMNIPNGGSTSVNTLEYRKAFLGQDEVTAQVAAIASIGASSITVNLAPQGAPTPAPVTFFRPGDNLKTFTNGINAKVVAVPTAGVIEIEPIGIGSTGGATIAQLLAALPVGSWVSSMGILAPNSWSGGVDPLNYIPEVMLNYMNVKRDGHSWTAADDIKTRVRWAGGMWSDSGVALACKRMLVAQERAYINGVQSRYNSLLQGEQDCNGGINWAIANRGGVLAPLTAAPTEQQFTNFLSDVHFRKARRNRMKLIMGPKMYAHVTRNFPTGYIVQMEVNQSGENKGVNLNYKHLDINGMQFDLVMNVQYLADPKWDANLSTLGGMMKEWSCYVIDADPVPVAGGAFDRPAIEKIHFGQSAWYAMFLMGIRDPRNAVSGYTAAELAALPNATTSVTALDGNTFQILYHGGIDMIGQYSGWMYAAV